MDIAQLTQRNTAVMVAATVAVAFVAVIAFVGGPRTYPAECAPAARPTSAKDASPSEKVALGNGQPLAINYGHNRGGLEDETEIPMKSLDGTALPSGPVAISHSLFERTGGSTSSISRQAIQLSAIASGRILRIRLCVDTTADPDLAPGRYVAAASIDDGRFELDQALPLEVSLQTHHLWRIGAPLALGVLVSGIWLATIAAGHSLRNLDTGIIVTIVVAVIAVAAQAFVSNGLADPTFGFDPIVQWLALAWAMGSAVTAAATAVFTTDAVRQARGSSPDGPTGLDATLGEADQGDASPRPLAEHRTSGSYVAQR